MSDKFDIIAWCNENLSRMRLNSTKQLVGDCPWCGKSGHFYVDSEKGHYICFACEEKGQRLVGLLAHVEGISFSEARKFILANSVPARRKETPSTLAAKIESMTQEVLDEPDVDYPLPREYIPVFKDGKWSYPVYLKERKIKGDTAKAWRLGWARFGRYAGRVIIPVVCPNGRSFTARDVTGEQDPRYLNPSGADHSKLLMGWEQHNPKGDLVIVEGPFDAIKMWQHGFSALSLMGKVMHVEQMSMLLVKPSDTVITVMLDPEEVTAPYNVATMLSLKFNNVYIAKLPEGVDPGSSTRKQAVRALDEAKLFDGNRVGMITDMVKSSRKKLDELYS